MLREDIQNIPILNMANSSMEALGAMAGSFNQPPGGFDQDGNYSAGPDASVSFDERTLNTMGAVQGAVALGGGVLPEGMGRMVGILPAAVKIGEMKKMQGVAAKYYEKYIKNFNRKYGFSEQQTKDLVKEFEEVTEQITRLIPDEGMRNMYKKYIESYPTMYLSMIPAEALQTKLAVKCVTENRNLRKKIEQMSSCVSTLVRNLTDLQISAGIPPIVNLMFESMPDPLTAMTDPMYHKYNDAIVTYHKLLQDKGTKVNDSDFPRLPGVGPDTQPITTYADFLRLEPVHFLENLIKVVERDGPVKVQEATGIELKENGKAVEITQQQIKDLHTVMKNMQTQSGCQPFGEEWNHQGPTPPMNPAMCLSDEDRFQTGNPRHPIGRTNMYQAKRDANGNAHWVQTGQVPALSAGGPQMVQHGSQPISNQLTGMNYQAGVDPRPSQHMSTPGSQRLSMHPSQHMAMHPSQAQFAQPYLGSGGTTGAVSGAKPRRSSKSKSSSGSKPRTSSKSKAKTSSGTSKSKR